jgi:hypothetical protein
VAVNKRFYKTTRNSAIGVGGQLLIGEAVAAYEEKSGEY